MAEPVVPDEPLPPDDPDLPGDAPVCLIGMMGSGKSTAGRRIASLLGRRFLDADRELESRCGVPITTIFELEGEEGFRRRESQMLEELSARSGIVLATGGGVVTVARNRELLRSRCFTIYLQAGAAELWHRLRNDRVRPLLRTADPRGTLAALFAQRVPVYRLADLAVRTEPGLSIADTAGRVIAALRTRPDVIETTP